MVLTAANGRLRQERLKRGWSEQALADRIQQWEYEHGDRHDLPVDRNYVHRWETGKRGVSAFYAVRLEGVFRLSRSELGLVDRRCRQPLGDGLSDADTASPPTERANTPRRRYPGDSVTPLPDSESKTGEDQTNRRDAVKTIGAALAASALQTRKLLHWAESPNVGPLTLAGYDEDVVWLSEHATTLGDRRLAEVASTKAAEVAALLLDGHHSGKQRQHLELLTGQFAYFQGRFTAYAHGQHAVARMHLRLAKHFGKELDHHLLLASVADVESTTAFYQGDFRKALEIAQEGQRYATAHTAARLSLDEAEAYGGLGPAFRQEMCAIDRAEQQLPDVPVFEPGAASPFDPGMFLYHAGTAAVLAGDERAEELAGSAIQEYEALEARNDLRFSFANLAAARLNRSIALVGPEPREAVSGAIHAVAVPREMQHSHVRWRLDKFLRTLGNEPALRNLTEVDELLEVARSYRPAALPVPPARPALGSS